MTRITRMKLQRELLQSVSSAKSAVKKFTQLAYTFRVGTAAHRISIDSFGAHRNGLHLPSSAFPITPPARGAAGRGRRAPAPPWLPPWAPRAGARTGRGARAPAIP